MHVNLHRTEVKGKNHLFTDRCCSDPVAADWRNSEVSKEISITATTKYPRALKHVSSARGCVVLL